MSSVAKWVLRNMLVTSESLTPEISLRLITEASPLWTSSPDKCPYSDPYWAFYWPGGQGLTRFILDNRSLFRYSSVLDFGCGCGSASIAVKLSGGKVLSNDVDTNALVATRINHRLNNITYVNSSFSAKNYLLPTYFQELQCFLESSTSSYIVLGDMFYDCDFASEIFAWLKKVCSVSKSRVLVGDPDRHPLTDHKHTTRFKKELLAEYRLPLCVTKENYGFTTTKTNCQTFICIYR
uniref:ETFB lysine methyltransferase n=1 Tax=Heterorhabditis bacteriophora TaxID=37862 RepID=A0A1I7XPN1_HETBA